MTGSWSSQGARLLTGALLAGLLAGATAPRAGATDLVPITQRAIAAVALEHAPTDTTHRQATWTDRDDPVGSLGADLRYHGDGEYDGDLLRTFISPLDADLACHGKPRCRVLETGDERVILRWSLLAPEEDPGDVIVTAEHGDEYTSVLYAGPAITADPRTLTLEIPVTTMVDIATEPRLRLLTTQDVVDAGAALTDWLGGEPDPHAYDRVAQTDLGQVAGMLLSGGGYGYYHHPRVSPMKKRFGPGAVGGRVDRRMLEPSDPSVLDVVAAPTVPAWLTRHPCVTGALARHCLRFDAPKGPVFLMWRPGHGADRGVVWAVHLRTHSVVALRTAGRSIPSAAEPMMELVDWWAMRRTVRSGLVGLTTQKRVLDFDLGVLGS